VEARKLSRIFGAENPGPGDTIILLSKALLRGTCVPAGEAAFAAAVYACSEVLAARLGDLAFANEDSPYAAVVVIRFDAFDVGREIDRLIDEFQPDPRHGEWLRSWAREHRALPAAFDMGGVMGMRRDGTVVSVAWDDPEGSTREETAALAHVAAIIGASRNYSSLKDLAPKRPADAAECPACESLEPTTEEHRGCPTCWYLGWTPPKAPPWFYLPVGQLPAAPWWRKIFGASK